MQPTPFKYQNKLLLPPGTDSSYPDYVESVSNLPVYTDGIQCVSCWRMSLRERLSALLFGRVWIALISGSTQPPIAATACRQYLREAQSEEDQ